MPSHKRKEDPDRVLEGALAIAEELNRAGLKGGEERAFYLLKTKQVDATKLGRLWVSTPRRVRRSLGLETS